MSAHPTPVSAPERIPSLDVLRGFAVLGILAVNIGAFSMPSAAYFDPTAYGDLTGLNGWIWRMINVFADLKFMAIFSMLFGAGIVLMSERASDRGHPGAGLHYRRMAWLIAFGILHAHLLWYGDILYWYGVCGLVIYLFRKMRPGWLIALGLLSMAVASGILFVAGTTMPQWPEAMVQQIVTDLKPPPDVIAAEVATYQGGWLEQMAHRVPKALEMELYTLAVWAAWRVGGLMLLGMGLFKLGLFDATRSPKIYGALVVLAGAVGVPVIVYGIQRNFAMNWDATYFFWFGLQYNYWASILVSLGWVGVIMLVCQRGVSAIVQPLAAVGRMAFTNYILQTVICTTLFYGHGFGLYGQVERTGQTVIVLAIWALQLVLSPIWLRHYQFGPIEWLWRSLVYLERQPFRRRLATGEA